MMNKELIISGSLMSLNEYIRICRGNKYLAAKVKKEADQVVSLYIMEQLRGVKFDNAVRIDFTWVCQNKRQDPDNICFAKKFILDALTSCGVIKDDGWSEIYGFSDSFEVDKESPRIIVRISEV